MTDEPIRASKIVIDEQFVDNSAIKPGAVRTGHTNLELPTEDYHAASKEYVDSYSPAHHHTRHEDGGTDEISVTGLSGLLADGQTPLAHKTSHQDGGTDEISIEGLAGTSAALTTHKGSSDHDGRYYTETEIDAKFNTSTGHDHDGTDSKKVTGGNVLNVPAGNIAATDVQAAINELDTEKSGTGHTHTHASTTGQTANDHHNQAHEINGADHTATSPLSVAKGGTGAATLTGVLKGNLTSAITGSATLDDVGEGTSYTRVPAATYTDLTDGGATTLHKHDHGGMDGLGDDDHTQYLNTTRGDARYYTETESDLRFAPIAKGVTNGDSHDHNGGDGSQINHTTLSNIGTNTHATLDLYKGYMDSGWVALGTVTYVSSDYPNYTLSVASDATSLLYPGMWITFSQNTTYSDDLAVGATEITVADTTMFKPGNKIAVVSGTGTEYSYCTAVSAGAHIHCVALTLNHNTTDRVCWVQQYYQIIEVGTYSGGVTQFTVTGRGNCTMSSTTPTTYYPYYSYGRAPADLPSYWDMNPRKDYEVIVNLCESLVGISATAATDALAPTLNTTAGQRAAGMAGINLPMDVDLSAVYNYGTWTGFAGSTTGSTRGNTQRNVSFITGVDSGTPVSGLCRATFYTDATAKTNLHATSGIRIFLGSSGTSTIDTYGFGYMSIPNASLNTGLTTVEFHLADMTITATPDWTAFNLCSIRLYHIASSPADFTVVVNDIRLINEPTIVHV
jgi:hypothetical protein